MWSLNLILLSVISLFTDIQSEIIMSLLPVFAVETLGIARTGLGIIEGISDAMTSFLKWLSGILSDRIKKRKLLISTGYIISTLAKSLMPWVKNFTGLLAIRTSDRIGKGIRTAPRDVLLSESVDRSKRGGAFGFHRTADTMGALIGSGVAGIGSAILLMKARTLFMYAIIPGVLASILTFFIREKVEEEEHKEERRRGSSEGFYFFLVVHTLYTFGHFTYAFYILKLREAGFSSSLAPVGYFIYNVIYTSFSYPMGRLADKIGGRKTITLGYGLMLLSSITAMHISSIAGGIVLMCLYGIALGVIEPVSRKIVADLSRAGKRGGAYGLFHFLQGIALLPASIIGGYLWDHFGSGYTFMWSAIFSGISCIMMGIWTVLLQKTRQ